MRIIWNVNAQTTFNLSSFSKFFPITHNKSPVQKGLLYGQIDLLKLSSISFDKYETYPDIFIKNNKTALKFEGGFICSAV